jgi:hypothetical protein
VTLRIDPHAGQPPLIGSRWLRRKPEGDDPWDGPVEVCGLYDNGPDHGGMELVVRTVAFTGEPVLTASAESFAAAYKREDEPDPLEDVRDRLRALEAAVG